MPRIYVVDVAAYKAELRRLATRFEKMAFEHGRLNMDSAPITDGRASGLEYAAGVLDGFLTVKEVPDV